MRQTYIRPRTPPAGWEVLLDILIPSPIQTLLISFLNFIPPKSYVSCLAHLRAVFPTIAAPQVFVFQPCADHRIHHHAAGFTSSLLARGLELQSIPTTTRFLNSSPHLPPPGTTLATQLTLFYTTRLKPSTSASHVRRLRDKIRLWGHGQTDCPVQRHAIARSPDAAPH